MGIAILQRRRELATLRAVGMTRTMVTTLLAGEAMFLEKAAHQIRVSDIAPDKGDAAVGDLMTALEPAMIVVLGVTVGGIVISMYMPIFSLVGQLSK